MRKTHLARSLAVAACQAGHMTYHTSLDDMVRKLRAADAAGRLSRQIRTYLRPTHGTKVSASHDHHPSTFASTLDGRT